MVREWALTFLLLIGAGAAPSPVDPGVPLSPEEGLKSIRVKEGFRVELVAAEPLVMDPVAIAWGPDGKLWVVEMADYPEGVDGNPAPPNGSRVRYLEDSDDDGKYDKSTPFMEGVSFPNGILPWRKGVLVTAAPEIFYAEDTDGDGKADKREVLYTGFTEGNPQLRINGLRWGLDNWVYLANGWSSRGKVKSVRTGVEVEVSGRDLRIRPDTGEIETVEGMTEFGRERDDWGDWFGCDNAHPMWHYVLPERYTRRNPHVPPPDPREQLIKPFPPRVYAASKPARRYNAFDIQDHFQSACSAVVYRDELLFERDGKTRQAFVCDPVHNLVHRSILTEAGVTFTAARAPGEEAKEFFASTDNWCRPVMALTGPDGALWVVDMYRFMIEHPEYLPDVGKKELEPHYRLGEDRGRIYRVVPKDKPARPIPRMDRRNTIELCGAAMNSPSGWERDTAQMLLVWNKGRIGGEARGELSGVVYASQNPLARMQALCTLEGLGAVTPEVLAVALGDSHWAVRRQALRIAEGFGEDPRVVEAALALEKDADPRVILQLALSAGEWKGEEAGKVLGALATRANDSYLASAVLSSAVPHMPAIEMALVQSGGPAGDSPLFRGLLRMSLEPEDDARMWYFVAAVTDGKGSPAKRMKTIAAWLDAVDARGDTLEKLLGRAEAGMAGNATTILAGFFERARAVVGDADAPVGDRTAAAAVLARWPRERDQDSAVLLRQLNPRSPTELQRACVESLGRAGGEKLPAALLENWAMHSPEVRGAVVDVLLRNETWTKRLLDAVEQKSVAAADIDLPRRQRLLNHGNKAIKERTAKLLVESNVAANRQKVLDAWRPVLEMKGDATRGKEMFRQHCAVCHKLNDLGQDVGPNLATVREWTGEAMLNSILDPNRQVEPKYLAYTATTGGGEAIFGIVAAESGNSITMKGLDGKERAVLRGDLKSLAGTGRSLMPDGFESAMSRQQMADLMQYLKAPEAAK